MGDENMKLTRIKKVILIGIIILGVGFINNDKALATEKTDTTSVGTVVSSQTDIYNIFLNKVSPQIENTPIQITTSFLGNNGYQYSIQIQKDTIKTIIKNFSSINSATWVPKEAGVYQIIIGIKDTAGKITYKTIQFEIKKVMQITSFSASKISPQELGNTINLNTAAIGTGAIQYRYIAIKGGILSVLKEYSIANELAWKPTQTGKYTIYSIAKDSTGKTAYRRIDYDINNPVIIKAFNTSSVSPQVVGTAIKLDGTAVGNGSVQYSYEVEKNNVKTVLKAYSSVNSVVWTPKEAGIYKLRILAKDELGKVAAKEINYSIVNPIAIQSVTTSSVSPQEVGTSINIKALATGLGSIQYKYVVTKDSKTTVLKDYSSVNEVAWKPTESGTYVINVSAKDATGKIVNVNKTFVINNIISINEFKTSSLSPQVVGTAIKLDGTAVGNGSVQYSYEVEKNSVKIVLKAYSSINSVVWTPKETGVYKLRMLAKDALGKTAVKEINYEIVNPIAIQSVSTNAIAVQTVGDSISLKTLATGLGNIQYKYLAILNGKISLIKDYSSVNEIVWKPTEKGFYYLYIMAKDSTGKVAYTKKTLVVNNAITINEFKTSSVSPQVVGTAIKLEGTAVGNGSVQYSYEVEKNNVKTVLKAYSSVNSVVWTPKEAGIYKLRILAKDELGKVAAKEINYSIVNPIAIQSVTTSSVSPQEVGTSINIKALATGLGSIQYKYVVTKDSKTTVLKDYSSVNEVAWKPTESGTYVINVSAKDATGKIVNVNKTFVINNAITINDFKTSSVSPQLIGTAIKLEGTAVGNGSVQYSYEVEKNNVKTVLIAYSTANNVVWTPKEEGTYKLRMLVKDALGKTSVKEISYVVIKPLVADTVKVSQTAPQFIGSAITLTASATGNGVLQYKFEATKNGVKTIIKDYSTSNSIVWTPKEAGTYLITLSVKDETGKIVTNNINYVIENPSVVINSLNPSLASPQSKGTAITFNTAVGSNGKVQYKYEVIFNGVTKLLKDYNDSNSVVWTPTETGVYKIVVSVKHEKGLIVTKQIDYTINVNKTQFYSMATSLGWKYLMKYGDNDLYQFLESGSRTAGLSLDSQGVMVTLVKATPSSEAIIKKSLNQVLPTQAAKVYAIISQPCADQVLKLDGKTVKFYKSNGYTVAKVLW
jgi:hypothetical protein